MLLFTGAIVFFAWKSYMIAENSKLMLKAILKKTIDIDDSHGTKAHEQLITNMYGIYAALWGQARYVWRNGKDGLEKTMIDRNV